MPVICGHLCHLWFNLVNFHRASLFAAADELRRLASKITAIGELDVRGLELTADDADLHRYHACVSERPNGRSTHLHLWPSVSSVVQSG